MAGEGQTRELSPGGGDLTQAWGLSLLTLSGPSRTGGKSQTWKGNGFSRHTFASAVLLLGTPSLLLASTSHPVNMCGLYSL